MKIRVEALHFDADQKLIEFIKKKLSKIERFYDQILDVNVSLKLENSGQVRDKIIEVLVSVPGDTIFVKEVDKTFETATDKVVDTLKRQVIRHKEMQRSY